MDAVFRPSEDITFSISTTNDFQIGSKAENPIPIDKVQDKENSTPLSLTPVSARPIRPPVLRISCLFGWKNEKVPDYVCTKVLE